MEGRGIDILPDTRRSRLGGTHLGLKSASWAAGSEQEGGLHTRRLQLVPRQQDIVPNHRVVSDGTLVTWPGPRSGWGKETGHQHSMLALCLPWAFLSLASV